MKKYIRKDGQKDIHTEIHMEWKRNGPQNQRIRQNRPKERWTEGNT